MPLIVPPATNYPGDVRYVPSFVQDEPREGRRQAACELLWNLSGPGLTFALDLGILSQFSTLKVDNSACGADVQFVFPDGEVITIPARSPLVVVPVFSNNTRFWIIGARCTAEDITRFIALNYLDASAQGGDPTNQAFVGSVAATWNNATVITQIVPATENGTLDSLVIGSSFNAGFPSDSVGQFAISDGAGTVFIPGWKMFSGPSSNTVNAVGERFRAEQMNIRFRQGLIMTFSVVTTWSGVVNANAFLTYRKP